MKRTFSHIASAVILSIGLLIASIGIPVSSHYCGTYHVTTQIGIPLHDACEGMSMPDGGPCCYDEYQLFSVTDFMGGQLIQLIKGFESATALLILPVPNVSITNNEKPFIAANSDPPPLIEPGIYVRVQSFLL